MKGRRLFVTGLLILLLLPAALPACKPADTKIPVTIKGASSVGSLHFEIIYDPATYRALRVDKGTSFADIMLEYDLGSPGHIVVGIISSSGISGEGTIVSVILQPKKDGANRTITVENVIANSAADMAELPVNVLTGESKGKSPAAPIIEFLPITE